MCELGEHGIGLHGRKHLDCSSQEDLLQLIVRMANEELERSARGAPEPAIQIKLLSGQYPSYAALKRCDSKLVVQEIQFHCGLDTRHIKNLLDRTMMTLICTWMDEPIKITICHCPSSKRRPWDLNVRDAVLPNLFSLAGLVPFKSWDVGAAEPAAWVLGGDLNLGENTINNEMKHTSPTQVTNT